MNNRIRDLRKEHKMTMKELGVHLGLAESTISQYETGKREPDNETLLRIGELFGVSVGYILGAENSPLSFFDIPGVLPVPPMRAVPLVGTIACGDPILAQENIESLLAMPEHINADFALRCKGDSMINARIFDGDIVYIRQQPSVEDGEIAAVLIDNEATLKRVRFYPDRISLEPANPMYAPIVKFGEEMSTVRILGKAVAFTSTIR